MQNWPLVLVAAQLFPSANWTFCRTRICAAVCPASGNCPETSSLASSCRCSSLAHRTTSHHQRDLSRPSGLPLQQEAPGRKKNYEKIRNSKPKEQIHVQLCHILPCIMHREHLSVLLLQGWRQECIRYVKHAEMGWKGIWYCAYVNVPMKKHKTSSF